MRGVQLAADLSTVNGSSRVRHTKGSRGWGVQGDKGARQSAGSRKGGTRLMMGPFGWGQKIFSHSGLSPLRSMTDHWSYHQYIF